MTTATNIENGNGGKAVIPVGVNGVELPDIDAMFRFARCYLQSGLAPVSFKNEQALIVCWARARELGIPYLQALEGMSVINGRLGLMGDLALALVERSNLLEDKRISYEGEGQSLRCTIELKRKNREWKRHSFGVADAKLAGIYDRSPTWKNYPQRMTYYRALGFALRDEFADVLKGMKTVEELEDYPPEAHPARRRKYDLTEPAPASVLAPDVIQKTPVEPVGKDQVPAPESEPDPAPKNRGVVPKLRGMLQAAQIQEWSLLAVLANPIIRLAPPGAKTLEEIPEESIRRVIEDFENAKFLALDHERTSNNR